MSLSLGNRLQFTDASAAGRVSAQSLAALDQGAASQQAQILIEGQTELIPLERALAEPGRYQAQQAWLSVPMAGGKALVVPLASLQRETLLAALEQIKAPSPVQQSEIQNAAAPLLAQIRSQTRAAAARIGPMFAGSVPAGSSLNAYDLAHRTLLERVEADVNVRIATGKLPPEQQKRAVLTDFLDQASPGFRQAGPNKREQILTYLAGFELDQLIAAEIQGAGGAAGGTSVTGSGEKGHYVPSMLTSLVHLLSNNRLSQLTFKHICGLQTAPLHRGLEPQRLSLTRCVLQDIAFPEMINQHAKGTCAATTGQILLAIHDPAAYVRVLTELASPSGKVGDGAIVREPGTLADDKSGRSLSGRLVQPAFMEYANGDLDYNNESDMHSNKRDGLNDKETSRLLQYLMPWADYRNVSLYYGTPRPDAAAVFNQLKAHVDRGSAISVGMNWREAAHRVIVTKIDPAKQEVAFINPWGELQRMALDEFKARLFSACVPRESSSRRQAMEHLPGVMSLPAAYQQIETGAYRTPKEQLAQDPVLNGLLTAEQRTQLAKRFAQVKAPTKLLDYLRRMQVMHPISPAMRDEIVIQARRSGSAHEMLQNLRIAEAGYAAFKAGTLRGGEFSRLLNIRPGLSLSEHQVEQLLDAIKGNDHIMIERLTDMGAKELGKLVAHVSCVEVPEAERDASRLWGLQDVLKVCQISERLRDALMATRPEIEFGEAGMARLMAALAQGNRDEVEIMLAKSLLKHQGAWDVDQAADVLEKLGKDGHWVAFGEVLSTISASWSWDSDNVAETITARLKPLIDQVPHAALHMLFNVMNDTNQDATTAAAKQLLLRAKHW